MNSEGSSSANHCTCDEGGRRLSRCRNDGRTDAVRIMFVPAMIEARQDNSVDGMRKGREAAARSIHSIDAFVLMHEIRD